MKHEVEMDNYIQKVYSNIGDLFKKVRKEKKVTVRDIYRDTGICIACISQLERASNFPRLAIIIKLADYLGIPLTDVLSEKVV